jgi:hypothetical protein
MIGPTVPSGRIASHSPVHWISWINLALGLWLAVAAFVLHHRSGSSVTEEVIAGLFVALAALWSAGAFRPIMSQAANWTVVLSGLWVLIAPFALRYDHPTVAVVNELVVGSAIVILALVEGRARARQPGA